ncbi:hypothetical protein OSTOST_02419 [Ostertagia ostertagi]
MQRPAPYSYHLDDQPRAVPSVYAADLELARGAANTTTYVQSGFHGTLPHAKQLENLNLNDSGDAPRPIYSRYADLPVYYNSTTDTMWDDEMAWKYSFHVPSARETPFGKGADTLKPTTPPSFSPKGPTVKEKQVSAYFDP